MFVFILFYFVLLCVKSSFAIILKRKRELVALLYIVILMSCYCKCSVSFHSVLWVCLQCVIVCFLIILTYFFADFSYVFRSV